MNLLVTGSSGHLGEALMRSLNETDHSTKGIDILPSAYTHFVGSIVDKHFVEEHMQGIDVVIHTATLHKPHIVTHSKHQFIDTNISGTLNLLEGAVNAGAKAFIFTSTTSTFGDAMKPKPDDPAVWVSEDLLPIPKNIYGTTKIAAEDLCQLFYRNHQLPCLILKTSRFFLEEDDRKELRDAYSDPNLKANEYLYRRADIQDIVDAHLLALEKAPDIGFGKYIITASSPFSLTHLAELNRDAPAVLKRLYPDFEEVYASKEWRMFPKIERVYVNDKARKELGWQPQYDFRYVLDCLKTAKDFRSPLALQIGKKGYHKEEFEDGPYPV